MAKPKKLFVCSNCQHQTSQWAGQCAQCQSWSTIEERFDTPTTNIVGVKSSGKATSSAKPAQRIRDINSTSYTHQSTGIGELDRVLGGGLVPGASIILAGPPGVGKALALDTMIPTPSGWTCMEYLKVGDNVYTENGDITKVVAVSPIWKDRPCYEVIFSDASSIIADENHEWAIETERKGPHLATTAELATLDFGNIPWEDEPSIPLAKPLSSLNKEESDEMSAASYSMGKYFAVNGSEDFMEACRYVLRASIPARRSFLAGALERRGQISQISRHTRIDFESLAQADLLVELVHSLGRQSFVTQAPILDGKNLDGEITPAWKDGVCYTVSFPNELPLVPTPTLDAQAQDKITYLLERRFIISVEPVESRDTRCIEVANESHLFLAGDSMIPTHNSSILSHVASIMSMKSKVLYISGEESVNQIKLRAERTNTVGDNFYLASENDLAKALWHINEIKPDLIIVDSMQTLASLDIGASAGSPSQVTEVATMFTRLCKELSVPLIMVGHFTKDGNVAGPRTVEHLVDVVLSFEGEDDSPLRLLRAIKNRFGAADEIGCFEHTEEGLQEVPDPSGLLLGDREGAIAGVCSSIFLEGKRPLPVEIQALVAPSFLPNPRRVTSGLDGPRTLMIQAVIDKRGGVKIGDKDVYVSTIAGTKIKESAVDLAAVIAIVSSANNQAVDSKVVALGEVTLSGEIRKVPGMLRRLNEAVRLGFNFAFVPVGTKKTLPTSFPFDSIVLVEVSHIMNMVQAVAAMGMINDK